MVLGGAETCTGDPARRLGQELLFQELGKQNVETLNAAGAKRIVVTCAHCFNALGKEYPQLGGVYEVVHHIAAAVPARRGRQAQAGARGGRDGHLPRPVLPGPAQPRLQPAARDPRQRARPATSSRCRATGRRRSAAARAARGCGWRRRSAPASTRPAPTRRSSTGAEVVAAACPYCIVMLTDGVTTRQAAGQGGRRGTRRRHLDPVAAIGTRRGRRRCTDDVPGGVAAARQWCPDRRVCHRVTRPVRRSVAPRRPTPRPTRPARTRRCRRPRRSIRRPPGPSRRSSRPGWRMPGRPASG